jgi:hypothetical protein
MDGGYKCGSHNLGTQGELAVKSHVLKKQDQISKDLSVEIFGLSHSRDLYLYND